MEKLALIGIAGFVLGVLAQSLFELSWMPVVYILFLTGILWGVYTWKRLRIFLLIAMFLLGSALGMVRTELHPSELPSAFSDLRETREIEGIVVADPDVRETNQRLTIEVEEGEHKTKILVVSPLYPEVRYGEKIRAQGVIVEPEPFDTDGGRVFAYDAFLAKDGIFLVMERAEVAVVAKRSGFFTHIRGTLSDLKFSGIAALGRALPEPHASLAGGLILGGKQGLGEELLDDFIRSGLVHIVVLSGYNVMIVADFITRAFGFLPSGWSAGLGVFSIAVFVLAAGAGPASIRAGLMAMIALYGRATGKTYEAFRALVFAGLIMILWNPLTLPYDPGFQLSFIATLGLIFGAPITSRWLSFVRSKFLQEIAASTIAAQIAVLPLLLYQNGLFSVVALPANLLVLPAVPLAMLASFIAMLAGWLVPSAAPALGLPAYALLSYITSMVGLSANVPLAAFTVPAFPFVCVLLAYGALIYYVAASSRRFSTTDQLRFERNAST